MTFFNVYLVDIDVENDKNGNLLDKVGTKDKGRLFALSSNPRAPATLPRTISQDSDVQEWLR